MGHRAYEGGFICFKIDVPFLLVHRFSWTDDGFKWEMLVVLSWMVKEITMRARKGMVMEEVGSSLALPVTKHTLSISLFLFTLSRNMIWPVHYLCLCISASLQCPALLVRVYQLPMCKVNSTCCMRYACVFNNDFAKEMKRILVNWW